MDCYCTSGRAFAACCEPILSGAQAAPTAEALMRARYAAYATSNVDFIVKSQSAEFRDQVDRNSVEAWSNQSEWLGMEIVSTEKGGPDDKTGVVEFIAKYRLQGQDVDHHEIATFRRDDGVWYFVDGREPKQEPFRRDAPKVRPNDPCTCGSGKKFKKCCGKPGAVPG